MRKPRGTDASAETAAFELHARLDRLRSFIWWTAPLYVMFVFAGLYLSNFVLTPDLGILLLVLSVFAFLDALALIEIRSIRARPLGTLEDFSAFQDRVDRLSKIVLWGGLAFAGIALIIFAIRLLALGA